MQDNSVRRVLEFFGRDNDWHNAREVADALSISVSAAVRLSVRMKNTGLLEFVRHPANDATAGMYRITPEGQAHALEVPATDETYIGGRATRVRRSSGQALPFLIAEPPISEFDVFVSYAGEDRDTFVVPLVEALGRSVRVWFDRDRLSLGDTMSKEIERGMKSSRFAAVVVSRAFIRKQYPDHEYHTLLTREINLGQKTILPIIIGDLTNTEISEYSPALADKYYLRANDYDLEELVAKIVQVVRPPSQEVQQEVVTPRAPSQQAGVHKSTHERPREPGEPSDALPMQPHLLSFQPCLDISFGNPLVVRGQLVLSWVIRNIGKGVARVIRVFLPGIGVDKPEGALMDGEQKVRGIRYDDKQAATNLMKPTTLVAEFEDHAGNLYRQYAPIVQESPEKGTYLYRIEDLRKPWLVPERIIPEEY